MAESDSTPNPPVRSAKVADPVKKTIEDLATAKGLLPQVLPQPPGPPPAMVLRLGSKTLMGTPEKHNPEFWKFAAARAANGWPIGFEITEADFDAEIKKHTTLAHG